MWTDLLWSPGDHHQNGEADGGPGEPGRWSSVAREVEDKADHAFPPGSKPVIDGMILRHRGAERGAPEGEGSTFLTLTFSLCLDLL